jgi:hypothetical protein
MRRREFITRGGWVAARGARLIPRGAANFCPMPSDKIHPIDRVLKSPSKSG